MVCNIGLIMRLYSNLQLMVGLILGFFIFSSLRAPNDPNYNDDDYLISLYKSTKDIDIYFARLFCPYLAPFVKIEFELLVLALKIKNIQIIDEKFRPNFDIVFAQLLARFPFKKTSDCKRHLSFSRDNCESTFFMNWLPRDQKKEFFDSFLLCTLLEALDCINRRRKLCCKCSIGTKNIFDWISNNGPLALQLIEEYLKSYSLLRNLHFSLTELENCVLESQYSFRKKNRVEYLFKAC